MRLVIILILVFVSKVSLAEIRVVESRFCRSMDKPECTIPCCNNEITMDKIALDKEGQRRIYFWTKVSVDEDKNIMHVWQSKDKLEQWAERVHVSRSDKLRNLTFDLINQSKEFLKIIFNSNVKTDNVQGVLLSLKKSPRYRTYSSIQAKPGTYTVSVYDYNHKLVPGGEPQTIKIK
jgi:hypothetical protein